MTSSRAWRRGAPALAFVVLAGGWYVTNLLAYAASLRTLHAANARTVAAGHPRVFTNLPTVWALQQQIRPVLFGLIGAFLIALLLRRASRGAWFLLAGALPVVVGHGGRLHGWWAPGPGIDQWTFGAGVGMPGLDLTRFGAGPSWTLAAGTLLAVAAVVVPAACIRPSPDQVPLRNRLLPALPYVALLAVGAALVTGVLRIDNTGDGSSHEMLLAAGGTALIATLASLVASQRLFWPKVFLTAVATGLVAVSGLNAAAMSGTKSAAFAAAAGVTVVAAWTTRRPWRQRGTSSPTTVTVAADHL